MKERFRRKGTVSSGTRTPGRHKRKRREGEGYEPSWTVPGREGEGGQPKTRPNAGGRQRKRDKR